MADCAICGKHDYRIPAAFGICPECLQGGGMAARTRAAAVHRQSRILFSLPPSPPRRAGGLACTTCINCCRMGEGDRGYCGLRQVAQGEIIENGGTPERGILHWYYDSLPTNCVADWVCAGGSNTGYPRYSHSEGPEYGYKNLAVFYSACSFNCLFCQNWQFRYGRRRSAVVSAEELADRVDDLTSCLCFFGGDPTPQIDHALKTAELAREKKEIIRICWETNGSMNPRYLNRMAKTSLDSGGCIKFDLKAWGEETHRGLTGASNRRTLENFKYLSRFISSRPRPPFLIASTLLVPGYVNEKEVSRIAGFIAELSPTIPYALLAFHPQFFFDDVKPTSWREGRAAVEAAQAAGLTNVRLGNIHLLW